MTEHNSQIFYDSRCLARPYAVVCSCSFTAACIDQDEADRVQKIHLDRATQHFHPCPRCASAVDCRCPFPDRDFDDRFAECPQCRASTK